MPWETSTPTEKSFSSILFKFLYIDVMVKLIQTAHKIVIVQKRSIPETSALPATKVNLSATKNYKSTYRKVQTPKLICIQVGVAFCI